MHTCTPMHTNIHMDAHTLTDTWILTCTCTHTCTHTQFHLYFGDTCGIVFVNLVQTRVTWKREPQLRNR